MGTVRLNNSQCLAGYLQESTMWQACAKVAEISKERLLLKSTCIEGNLPDRISECWKGKAIRLRNALLGKPQRLVPGSAIYSSGCKLAPILQQNNNLWASSTIAASPGVSFSALKGARPSSRRASTPPVASTSSVVALPSCSVSAKP